jgi:EmrB/QacA subfamily drug resistance transporter
MTERDTAVGAADAATRTAEQRLITVGLVLSMAVIAVETTVVTTALPTVVGELQGLELYPWIFSAYLLASTVVVPIFGKLADLYGRRPIYLGGMAVFVLGSVLCGLASSMPQLVLWRALQGLGAGAVMPMVFTIAGDAFTLRERGKIQGLMSALWGTMSLVGPGLGAFLTLSFSWRWVFLVNVPFALLGAAIIARALQERVEQRRAQIDYAGAATITVGLLVLLVVMLEGGRSLPWGSPQMLGLLGLSAGLLGLFVWIELRAEDPLLPLSIFRHPIVAVASIGNTVQGAQIFGLTAYIPLYVQGVRGETAAGAGAALTPLLLGWSLGGLVGPRFLLHFGFRPTALLGTGLIMAGALPLIWLHAATPAPVLTVSMALLGAGFGPSMTAFVVAVQNAMPWELRGVASSSMQLFRSLSGTIGVALMGALLNSQLAASGALSGAEGGALLDPAARQQLDPAALAALQGALAGGLQAIFTIIALLAALALAVMLGYARNDPDPSANDPRTSRQPAPAADAP